MAKLTIKDMFTFIEQNPGCYADDIAKSKSVTRDVVLGTFRTCIKSGMKVRREGDGRQLRYFVDHAPQQSMLAKAVSDMIQAITQDVREQIDSQLDILITAEVDAALADVQNRIRIRLAGAQQVAPQSVPQIVPQPVPQPVSQVVSQVVSQPVQQPEPFQFTVDEKDFPPPEVFNIKSKRTTPKPSFTKSAEVVVQKGPPQQDRKKIVVIVGIHANKQALIKREFKDCFDLRMLNPDQHGRISSTVTPTSKNVVLIDFVGHRHSECITSLGYSVINVTGGMTTLRETLTAIYVGEK